jgi:hypothetical protein
MYARGECFSIFFCVRRIFEEDNDTTSVRRRERTRFVRASFALRSRFGARRASRREGKKERKQLPDFF